MSKIAGVLPVIAVSPSLSLAPMESLARILAEKMTSGDIVTLRGDLGSGKTTFARALIRRLTSGEQEVTSPTFTLMQSYEVMLSGNLSEILWHLDLYRLEDPRELEALGLEDILPHLVLIEWPEIAEALLPESRLEIAFAFDAGSDSRQLTFSGNDAWRERLNGLF